jgi:hypothetical protein
MHFCGIHLHFPERCGGRATCVQEVEPEALKELFEADVSTIAGTEGKHRKDRTGSGRRAHAAVHRGRRLGLKRPQQA